MPSHTKFLHRTRSHPVGTAFLAGAVIAALSGISAIAALPAAADDLQVTLVGDLQSEIGCTADWDPACEESVLTATGSEDVYSSTFEIPEGSWNYKVAIGGTWDEAYGLNGGQDNIPLTIAGPSRIQFTFDMSTQRVGITPVDLNTTTTPQDSNLASAPVRAAGENENFYFVMTDRFENGDTSNDTGGLSGDRYTTGFDPTDISFYQGGDIAGLTNKLDYIQGLGTTAIWLTPSFKNKAVQGDSAGYHGYWITDFTQIDPHLGTNAELKEFIDDAHARGIDVYFDIITNHTADVISYEESQYTYVEQADDPYTDTNGNPFLIQDVAGSSSFPTLSPLTSFPYTPVVTEDEKDIKVPAWLNDVTKYHNRGDSTWTGESVTLGDFNGLDDIMTEDPEVVDGFVDVYDAWVDMGIDGFRIDTVKHVNTEFWNVFTKDISEHAASVGNPDFFMFGEVYDADPTKLSPYVRNTDMDSVLDFYFQQQAVSYATGGSANLMSSLYAGDDYYTTATTSAAYLPTFLGNHDMGRVGYFARNTTDPMQTSLFAHQLMYLTRGQPVVYYGDEQGFVGSNGSLGGTDKDARQSMFGSQTAQFQGETLLSGEKAGSDDHFDTDSELYTDISELATLRTSHPALQDGAQIERLTDSTAGIYAFSRVDRDEKVEYLVVANNSSQAKSVHVPTLTDSASFTPLYGSTTATSSDSDGYADVAVPATSAVVLVANKTVSDASSESDSTISVSLPAAGAALKDLAPVSAQIDGSWHETTFLWRVVGDSDWTTLGTAEDTSPRVFHDVSDLATGTLVEYRAVAVDASGTVAATSSFASVGNNVSTEVPTTPENPTYDSVSVPGSHNQAMGCASDWQPACGQAQLKLRADGIWAGTFDLPAGTYEYKVAVNDSWDINFGAGGVSGGDNITYVHPGGEVSFYFDPNTGIFQNTSEGPIVTLAGDFQSQLGCTANWAPDQLCAWMHADDAGKYRFSTSKLEAGTYSVKVAHGLSWEENYGQGGVLDGSNISFTVTGGETVTFTYDIETHELVISTGDEPTGEPTETPTGEPTETPTGEPTQTPTGEPTQTPTDGPSGTPTASPSSTGGVATPTSSTSPSESAAASPTVGSQGELANTGPSSLAWALVLVLSLLGAGAVILVVRRNAEAEELE
ncbi:alpha-amylase family glycosyl hydrolase [Changpingibacter yushuensis]|uniref:pullulanase X25 domain-containing protein n=1 Tax=Changpingibacter yushuensis TaxID=2758440 RepID=UPI001C7107B9|nr:alpha-amylase family glycosyl hydrolase [Changpingibacter yushuensis]